jgi:hypothetical protein
MTPDGATRVVVDSNVLAVAEGLHPQASDECRSSCIGIANQIHAGRVLSVDTGGEILSEYLKVLKESPASGIGKKLALFLHHRQWDSAVCRKVPITPGDPPPRFVEVPDGLSDFDEDDHAFIAVAAADEAIVLQALDREWWERKTDFAACGIDIQFLCTADLLARESQP